MRFPSYPWELHSLLKGKPTVGWLMDLCDENYRQLICIAPALRMLGDTTSPGSTAAWICILRFRNKPLHDFGPSDVLFPLSEGTACGSGCVAESLP